MYLENYVIVCEKKIYIFFFYIYKFEFSCYVVFEFI